MPKASSVVASVTQQFHSFGPSTENAGRPHKT